MNVPGLTVLTGAVHLASHHQFFAYRKRSYGWALVHESSENGDDWSLAVEDPVDDLRERLADLTAAGEVVDIQISGASPRAIQRVLGLVSVSANRSADDV